MALEKESNGLNNYEYAVSVALLFQYPFKFSV